jgi:hypothetical protein
MQNFLRSIQFLQRILYSQPVSGTEVNELIQSQENKNTKIARPWQQEFSETGEEKDTYAF